MDVVSHFEVIRLNQLIRDMNSLSNLADVRQIRRMILSRMDDLVLYEQSKFVTEVGLCICRYFLDYEFREVE